MVMRRVDKVRALGAEADRILDDLASSIRPRTIPPSSDDLVHPTAQVSPSAQIAKTVRIGAFAIVGDHVVIEHDCVLEAHSIVRAGSVIGQGSVVDSFAVIGGNPQDVSFDPRTASGVTIGRKTIIREGATVHRSNVPGGVTRIGDEVILMTNSHVGHDGLVGDGAILTNNVMLGGHVHVGRHAFLGGGAGIHQHTRIGEGAMIGGNASISYDVPPFTLAADRNRIYGLNFVGLRRRGFSTDCVTDLRRCYRAVFRRSGDLRATAEEASLSVECGTTESGRTFLDFFRTGRRGFARPRTPSPGF
jgi:UDP-N-acetylglucosamine acyltransferase